MKTTAKETIKAKPFINSFISYTSQKFTYYNHLELRNFAATLVEQGVNVMVSNSNTDYIRCLCSAKPFKFQEIEAPRSIGGKNSSRNSVKELLITTY